MDLAPVYYDVEALRENEFPLSKEFTYLNHASISPLPQRAEKAAHEAITHLANNAFAFWGEQVVPIFNQFLEEGRRYLNASETNEICPITSTSAGLNAVANAIQWREGDQVILCDVEFPSNVYPWLAQERHGVEVKIVPAQHGTLTVELLEREVTSRTRLIAVSAVQFFTGAKANLHALGEFCRQHDILFAVDAIQAIGHMPINVEAMHIDILASGGQKSLMALTGVGLLYVRRSAADKMIPSSIGPNATEDWEFWLHYNPKPLEGAHRFMSGTLNVPGLFTVVESLRLFEELGREHIDAYTTALSTLAIEKLVEKGFTVLTPYASQYHGPIVTFQYATSIEETDAFIQKLAQQNIVVTRHLNAKGEPFIRLSIHCYNNEQDIETFLHSL